jgi:hypothetical protein
MEAEAKVQKKMERERLGQLRPSVVLARCRAKATTLKVKRPGE